MTSTVVSSVSSVVDTHAGQYFHATLHDRYARADRMMIWLLGIEWFGLMATAGILSLLTWSGAQSRINPHFWAAVLAGPGFVIPTIAIALLYPARQLTRHAIAVSQMFVSILLIDVTGGRIESHFHIFGSLAFLAFYRDRRVLLTATIVTALDHFVRGIWWPASVYGILTVSPWRWVEHAFWVVFEDFFLLLSMRTSVRDMWSAATAKARLYEGASHDVLTGLPNRRLLQERFDGIVNAPEMRHAILFIDLDRFKQANDSLGHSVGDKLLAVAAARLRETVGALGTVARIGGDEFVVLIEGVTTAGELPAEEIGQRLLGTFTEPFYIDTNEILLSASIGISFYPEHGTTLAALQERADRAMYAAKASGRNQCLVFSSDVSLREERMREIAMDISSGLVRNEFVLHYQPLISRNGQLRGFEALVRWNHPRLGMVPPNDFIPLAEKSGHIVSLGDWVLKEACRACLTWQKPESRTVGVAVNVSVVQFEQPDYPDRVFSIIKETGINPESVTLEVTESVRMKNAAQTRDHLRRLHDAGLRIALDDFGTGYCSLSYITELPANMIKLDRSFLNSTKPGAVEVVESVVRLAHRLGLEVVAEGVETSLQNQQLLDLQCDAMQGFYFSRPVTAAIAAQMVESDRYDDGPMTCDLGALESGIADQQVLGVS